MNTIPALTAFRVHLVKAAALDLERLYPAWVGTVRAAPDHAALQSADRPTLTHDRARFAPYRQLLTLVAELELYLLRYEGVERFSSVPADAARLDALGLTGLDWAWMLLHQVAVATQGLIDRTERIITDSLDLLMGSYDPHRVTEERPRLLQTVGEMRQGMDMFRGSIFQGALSPGVAGSIGLLVDLEMWEVSIALGEAPDLRSLFPETEAPETARYRSDMCRAILVTEVEAVEQSFQNLDAAIDWSRVRAT